MNMQRFLEQPLHTEPSNPHTRANLYLSDAAHAKLVTLAREAGYVRSRERPDGLWLYLEALSLIPDWQDTRPAHIQEASSQYAGPQWMPGDHRRVRTIRALDPAAVARYTLIAEQYRILPGSSQYAAILGTIERSGIRRSRHGPLARVSAVLEAIGSGWLTPTTWPTTPRQWHSRPKTTSRRVLLNY